jgi:hypothetical protein
MGVARTSTHKLTNGYVLERNLAAIGWGLFFVWVGAALLSGLSEGVGLLGIGVITLGMQALRRYLELPTEGFWIFIGSLFSLGGIWALFSIKVGLLPIVLLAAGVLLLLSVLRREG